MHPSSPRTVAHLELHTGDQARASAFYATLLCWRPQVIEAGPGSYLALEQGRGFGGGQLGASVLLAPREGPAGWRNVVSAPGGGELASWAPER